LAELRTAGPVARMVGGVAPRALVVPVPRHHPQLRVVAVRDRSVARAQGLLDNVRRVHLVDGVLVEIVDRAADSLIGIERIDDVTGRGIDVHGGDGLSKTGNQDCGGNSGGARQLAKGSTLHMGSWTTHRVTHFTAVLLQGRRLDSEGHLILAIKRAVRQNSPLTAGTLCRSLDPAAYSASAKPRGESKKGANMRKLLCCTLFSCIVAWSQTATGSIRGTITDPTKAPVPGAKVIATDVDRNVEYPTSTDTSGRYIFPTLPVARYELTVEVPGFQKAAQTAFQLEVQQQATVDISLTVGEMTTKVEVTASAPILNTTSATLGQVVENRLIESTPNSGRNPLSLVLLAPGIVGSTGGVAFVSNGVRNNSAEVLMDGGALTS